VIRFIHPDMPENGGNRWRKPDIIKNSIVSTGGKEFPKSFQTAKEV
jgi:hypothetical protein